jgi:hypothetical protein
MAAEDRHQSDPRQTLANTRRQDGHAQKRTGNSGPLDFAQVDDQAGRLARRDGRYQIRTRFSGATYIGSPGFTPKAS